MTWLTPLTGLILAASVIPPLVLLYFLKLRRRPQPIACTILWKRSVEDLCANAPFQRLRRSLLFFLQLLALTLIVLSVMQPRIVGGRQEGGKTVLLIDNSASMTATDVDGAATRLDEAKRRGRERIEALYGGGLLSGSPGETMVVAFSDGADIASRFSRSRQELLNAVDRIGPTDGQTRIGEALTLARAYTTNVDPDSDRPIGDPAALEVFTDGRIADLDDQVLRGERMVYHRVGSTDADNVGISTVSVERPYDRPTSVEVFAALLNYGAEPVTCDVQLSVNLTARAVEEVTIAGAEIDDATGALRPGRNNIVFTPFEQPRGAVIGVACLRPDDLEVDNVARVVVPPPKRLRVALVAPRTFLVRTALEGLRLRELRIFDTPQRYEELVEDGGLDDFDVVVFEDYAPPVDRMPPGRYLTFGATPPVAGLNEFGEAEAQIALSVRDEHPALRFVRLDDLYVARSRLLQPADDVSVLVEGSEGPLVVSVSRGPMQLIHVPFDPAQSNWPLQRSWVTFIYNAIDYLGHLGEGLTEAGFSVGEALTTRLPVGATAVQLEIPDGQTLDLQPADPTMFTWGPIRRVGLYRLSWEAPGVEERQSRTFAVNLTGEFEGGIPIVEDLAVGQEVVSGAAGEASAYTPLWPYAISFCLLVLMIEWWVYHRKAFL